MSLIAHVTVMHFSLNTKVKFFPNSLPSRITNLDKLWSGQKILLGLGYCMLLSSAQRTFDLSRRQHFPSER